jgi:hypothetical protein
MKLDGHNAVKSFLIASLSVTRLSIRRDRPEKGDTRSSRLAS